jgi:hypothetical protein
LRRTSLRVSERSPRLERLERFGAKAELVEGDFLTKPLSGPFEAILALGLFDYTPEPERFARQMFELLGSLGQPKRLPLGCVHGADHRRRLRRSRQPHPHAGG